ncbi:MAG: beta strand repeat-containing protein, partial [Ferruginibacter sp.]
MNKLYYFFLTVIFIAPQIVCAQATLPLSRTAWSGAEPTGWTNSGATLRNTSFACTGSDARTFDTNGDLNTVFFSGTPNQLTFKLKSASMNTASSMLVQQSIDGTTWTAVGTYGIAGSGATVITDCADIVVTLTSTSRYVRWTYTKGSGNCDLDDVSISLLSTPADVAISNGTIGAPTVLRNDVDVILQRFDLTVTTAAATLNGLTVTTAGTYVAADISNLKVRYSADATLNAGDATLSTFTNPGAAGSKTFPSFTSQVIGLGTTGYLFVTADISSTAVNANTISLGTTAFSNISFVLANKSGTNPVAIGGTKTIFVPSPNSNIIRNTGFTEPSNVDYYTYQENADLTSANSLEVAQFTIQDGSGVADYDVLNTGLSSITFSITNSSLLRRLAIYDGGTEITGADVSVTGSTVTFSGLTGLTATDGLTKTFSLRASFAGSVTDNLQFAFTITAATATAGGSTFAAANAGGAATLNTLDRNRIEVFTTALIFNQEPTTVVNGFVMAPSVTVNAIDALVNFDLDNISAVTLSITTGTTTFDPAATVSVNMVAGVATFNNLIFNTNATGNQLTAAQVGETSDISFSFNVIAPTPEINIKQGVTNYASASTYAFGNVTSGTNSSTVTFTIENTGTAALTLTAAPLLVNISGTNASEFTVNQTLTTSSIGILTGTTTFTITFSPLSQGAKTAQISISNNDGTGSENPYIINLTGTGTVSNASNIVATPGYVYPQNIAYLTYQENANIVVSGTSLEVASFRIQDGGGSADADNLGTTLTQIVFTVSNSAYIRRIALYDGATEVGTEQVSAGTVTFSGLNLIAADGSFKDFTVRVSFTNAVVDQNSIRFTVAATTTAATTGSTFAATNAGGAATSITGNDNRINVVADRLFFSTQPSNVNTYANMTSVVVRGVDVNNLIDLGFVDPIRINSTGTLTGDPVVVTPVSGEATFSTLVHTAAATLRTLTARRNVTADWALTSNTFTVTLVSKADDYFKTKAVTGNWGTASNWESSLDNNIWITATLAPTAAAKAITIIDGSNITVASATNADELTVQATAILTVNNVNFTIANGAGTDMVVNGRVDLTGASGIITTTGTVSFGAGSFYNHNRDSGTIPTASWNNTSTCTVTGMTNFLPVNLAGIGQAFGNFNWNNASQVSYVNIESSAFSVSNVLTVGPTTNVGNKLSFGNAGGPYTNAVNRIVISGGQLNGVGNIATTTVNVTNDVTISGGLFAVSDGDGLSNFTIGTDLNISGGTVAVLNLATSPSQNLVITRDLNISGTGKINLEVAGSTTGVGTITVNRDFISTSTSVATSGANGIVDFGTGTVTGNSIQIKRHFDKSGTGTFGTSATGTALGFVFSGTGTQTLSYAGANSLYTSYQINSGSTVQLLTNLTMGSGNSPVSFFTVQNGASLNFSTFSLIAGATNGPQFNAQSGATLITSNTNGIGGTPASGSLQSWGAVNITAANGTANLPAGVNYTFNANTTTPYPATGFGVYGNPGLITVNAAVTYNRAATLTVTTGVTVNTGGTFTLNSGVNTLNLNNATLLINTGGIFDNNGENQITNGGGTPAINIFGTFITRDAQGFTGTNTAIPGITPTLNTDCTIEFGRAGDQSISIRADYQNLRFTGGGIKTHVSANNITPIAGTVTIPDNTTVDVSNNTFGSAATNFTMTNGR